MVKEGTLKAEFCKECKSFLNLPWDDDFITCVKCGTKTNIWEFDFKPIKTFKDYSDVKKDWLDIYNKKKHSKKENIKNSEKDIIEQPCNNDDCDSNRCYYTALQIRSADEGQTIFYECIKCGERFTLNN